MDKAIKSVLISKEQIDTRVKEIAEQINKDFAGEEIMLVCILRGASVFASDLLRQLKGDVTIDFISVSSYGAGTASTGEVKLSKDLTTPIAGKNVIIVEDIIDTGLTLKYLKKLLESRSPKALKICAFLDKPSRRTVDMGCDYTGFSIPNEFVIGYGLDYDEKFRNLPEVCILDPQVYNG